MSFSITNNLDINTQNLQADLDWLKDIIECRFDFSFFSKSLSYRKGEVTQNVEEINPPELQEKDSTYAQFVLQNELSLEDRVLLMLSIAPHIDPNFLDLCLARRTQDADFKRNHKSYSLNLNEVGGVTGDNFRGFIPTGLTWLFIVAGHDLQKRMKALASVNRDHLLLNEGIITFKPAEPHEPILSGAIAIDPIWLRILTVGDIQTSDSELDEEGNTNTKEPEEE